MPGGNYMGGVPFLGVYLSVEPMIFTPVHPIMGFHLLDLLSIRIGLNSERETPGTPPMELDLCGWVSLGRCT